MRQLSRLRTLSFPRQESAPPADATAGTSFTTAKPSGDASCNRDGETKFDPGPLKKEGSSMQRSLFLEHDEDNDEEDERGCMEAVSAFLAAVVHDADKQDSKRETAKGASPALLQTSKGAGTIECLDSARELLRFFGHSPLLHLEGVIWVKTSGERAHCLAALSNWSLFLVPLRDPSFIGGALHGFKKGKKHFSDRIVEVPLGSIVDVAPVGGREHLKTFRTVQANMVSRPFRITAAKNLAHCESAGESAADKGPETSAFGADEYRHILLVGFEDICRLRHFLVVACESWAIRSGVETPAKELLSCAPVAAQRYLAGVLEVMTGPLRDQVDVQVELMEDLADEMILDAVVKEAFFSTGDIFFEISRRLGAAADTVAERSAVNTAAGGTAFRQDGFDGSTCSIRRDGRRAVVSDARLISATASVLDAAFFHSIQIPQRIHLVGRPKPMSLPAVAEDLVFVYCALCSRIVTPCEDGADSSDIDTGGRSSLKGFSPAGVERLAEGAMSPLDTLSTGVLDRVVRALNGISDVVSLFNIENEHLGIVRNLVGVGLGVKVRVGIQPAASDALAFLVRVNDRAVDLIEDLDRREQERRQLEAARLLALGPTTVSPTSEKNKGKKRSVFARLGSLSPRPRRSVTPPLSPPSPAVEPPVGLPPINDNSNVRINHLLEGSSRSANKTTARTGAPKQEKNGVDNTSGGLVGLEGRRGGRNGGRSRPPISPTRCSESQDPSPRGFLSSAPVLLHSYAKLLNALVCGSYNLREAFFSACEVDIRNIGREGGYLDVLSGLDGGAPRLVFRQTALFLHEIANLFYSFNAAVRK
ncbi:unnamed protein product [Ectocarpus fasciculatus]